MSTHFYGSRERVQITFLMLTGKPSFRGDTLRSYGEVN